MGFRVVLMCLVVAQWVQQSLVAVIISVTWLMTDENAHVPGSIKWSAVRAAGEVVCFTSWVRRNA